MTKLEAIEVLQSHKSHWERLLREQICDKTEGINFINAVAIAINAIKQAELEELKEEIKQTLIQSNKDLINTLDEYSRGWLGGNLEIVRILEKHYGKIIDDDEIMRESEEEE